METISIDIVHYPLFPDVAVLEVKGFLNAQTLIQMDKSFQIAAGDKRNLLLDLSQTQSISSGGWGFLITAHQKVREMGGDLVLAGMNSEVQDSFELLEYHKVIRSFSDTPTALKQAFHPSSHPVS